MYDPNSNTTLIIIPKHPYLLVNHLEYRSLDTPCQPITEQDTYLCLQDNEIINQEDTCLVKLMKFQTNLTLCEQHTVQVERVRITNINIVG